MRKIRITALLLLTLGFGMTLSAKVSVSALQAGTNYYPYPVPEEGIPTLSPSPDGYTPFHIEHYGRHGSRWRIGENEYADALRLMQKAHDNKKLTPRGEVLFEEIQVICADSKGRLGELTPLGHRQHRGIANRMAKNFPEIFTDSTLLDAKSTEVIRCILSMANEVAELQRLFPNMPVTMDASQTTQPILNYNDYDPVAWKLSNEAKGYVDAYRASLPKPDKFYKTLFNDRKFVTDSLGDDEIFKAIFNLAINVPGHDHYAPFYDVFTEEELTNEWLARNADWYIRHGNTPLTKNRVPFNQRVLLKNIIESADTALLSPRISANLRFGHDTMLLPLSVLMELDNVGYQTTDLSTLADNWRAYEVTPMAGNIQIIFYRPSNGSYKEDDVLVKVMLNEKETTLPVTPATGNYYRWTDLRKYYLDKIDNMPNINI